MGARAFVDYYEVMRVSPNADGETIERIFRHLAKRYHPDNPHSGDAERFHELAEAHRVLSDPEQRAAYDVRYQEGKRLEWNLLGEASRDETFDESGALRERLLSLLYVQRRRDVRNPSVGNIELERLLACPSEHLEFHLWYLKEKSLVERTDKGFAITARGVDAAESARQRGDDTRMLPDQAESIAEA